MSVALMVLACATCYGDPNSSQAQGVTAAVWFMVGTVGVVLGGLSAVFLGFIRRARRAELQQGV
jgi:hypothetical protein